MLAGLAWMVACGAGAASAAIAGEGETAAMVLAGVGVLGYIAATIAAMVPQRVTLDVVAGEITPSWRPAERGTPVLGSWVVTGIDAPMGLVLRVGALKIGGDGLDGAGYAVIGAATRTVDCHVGREDFEALCAAVGIRKGELGPVIAPLVRSSQSVGGLIRTMAPWLVTMVVVSTVGIVAGQFDVLMTQRGQLAMTSVTMAIVVAGIVAMVMRSRRIRAPELELRVTPEALVLAKFAGDAISRTPWSAVRVERRRFTQTSRAGSYTMPMLVLAIEGHAPLRVGAWDTRLAWADEPEKAWRGPRWIIGSAVWPRLVEELGVRCPDAFSAHRR